MMRSLACGFSTITLRHHHHEGATGVGCGHPWEDGLAIQGAGSNHPGK